MKRYLYVGSLAAAILIGFLLAFGSEILQSGVVLAASAYTTIASTGAPLTQRTVLNFVNGGCVDNAGASQTDCTIGATGSTGATGPAGPTGATGGGVIAAPPYLNAGGNLYISADSMYQATLPSLGSWTWLSTTATPSTGPNGDALFSFGTSVSPAFFKHPSAITSIESVVSAAAPLCTAPANGGVNAGVWMWDSTNSKIYYLALDQFDTSGVSPTLFVFTYTYTGSGQPTSGANVFNSYFWSPLYHLKLTVSSTTLSFLVSLNGGATYSSLLTQTVGTIGGLGIAVQKGCGTANGVADFMSIVTQ